MCINIDTLTCMVDYKGLKSGQKLEHLTMFLPEFKSHSKKLTLHYVTNFVLLQPRATRGLLTVWSTFQPSVLSAMFLYLFHLASIHCVYSFNMYIQI